VEDPFDIEMLRNELRRLSVLVDEQNVHAAFAPNDCPFVDKACECIEHGGHADHIALASLLHHVAENLES